MIYIKKYEYNGIARGQKKKTETANGRDLLLRAYQKYTGLQEELPKISLLEHGKPYFPDKPDLEFNISHSGEYVAVMLGDTTLGVDIERCNRSSNALIKKLCSEREKEYILSQQDESSAFIRLWTLKESYIKATGSGMSFPLDKINFDMSRAKNGVGKISNQSGIYFTMDFDGYSLSACVLDENIEENKLQSLFEVCML